MSDDLQTPESGTEQASQGLPIPKLEGASPVSSTSSVDTKALAAEVAKLLKPDFERVAQSTKDKRIAALEKKLGASDLAELESMGVQVPENVKLEYRLRNLEGGHTSEPAQVQSPSSNGNGEALTAQDVSEVIKEFQLDANNAVVLEKLRGTYRNRDHFQAEMAKIALAQVNRQPPSPASSTSLTGGSVATNTGSDELANEMNVLYRNPSAPGAMKRIAEIQEQMRKAG